MKKWPVILFTILVSCNSNRQLKEIVNFNIDWEFVKNITTNTQSVLLSKTDTTIHWEKVSLPHTANIEPLVTVPKQWQGTCYYRKYFKIPKKLEGKYIAIQIGAAMHEADIFFNGAFVMTHKAFEIISQITKSPFPGT